MLRVEGSNLVDVWPSDEVLSNHYATSVHADGFLYGFHGRQEFGQSFRAVELRTGKVRWSEEKFRAGSVTLAGDRLVILREAGELVLAAASPDAFRPLARAQVLPAVVRAFPALADGFLYARNENTLVCLDLRRAAAQARNENTLVNLDLRRAAAQAPADPGDILDRAVAEFESGRIAESAASFDEVAKLAPAIAPQLWQRGIALYYAGRYGDCRRQFESHRTVNPDDVENAAWHFLCVARAESPERARAALLPVGPDSRVPMRQVYEMFRGKLEPAQVLAAAGSRPGGQFYAQLYLGLVLRGDRRRAPRARAHRGGGTAAVRGGGRLHAHRRADSPGAPEVTSGFGLRGLRRTWSCDREHAFVEADLQVRLLRPEPKSGARSRHLAARRTPRAFPDSGCRAARRSRPGVPMRAIPGPRC